LLRGNFRKVPTSIRPPWAIPENDFVDRCARRNDCRDACPEGIIIPGQSGFPAIDFKTGACTFCKACAEACPTGALSLGATADGIAPAPWSLALEVKESCLNAKGVVCRICEGKCETEAIRFGFSTAWGRPRIDADACNGCGACVAPCPVGALVLAPAEKEPSYA